jgi:sn-glycerol 3-phosphate transport system substrate-binding protein
MWYSVGGEPQKATQVLIERFNQSQNKVIVEAVYSGSYEDTMRKLLAAAVAGGLPTIAHMAHCYAPQMALAGYLETLDDLLAKEPGLKADYVESLYMANVYQGKTYGVPYNCSTPVYYYSKDLYKKAGLDPEKSPVTWEDMYRNSAKIAGLGGDAVGYNIERGSGWLSQGYTWEFGGEWIKADNSAVTWDQPGDVEALAFMKKMVKDKVAVYKGGDKLDASGRSGGSIRSTASLTSIVTRFQYEVGVGPVPYKTKPMVPIGGGSLYIVKGKPQAEKLGAWEFLKFATNPVSQMFWSKATGYQASSKKAVASTEMKQLWDSDSRYKKTYDQLNVAQAENHTWLSPFQEVRDLFNDTWDKTILNDLDPKAALADAKAKADKVIAENK